MKNSRALWFNGKKDAEIVTRKIPDLENGECKIETHHTSISSGTELLVYRGKIPSELHTSMKCPYFEGSFSFPVKYGYSLVGRVFEGSKSLMNKYVHILHPHQDVCVVKQEDVFVIPDNIPLNRATLGSNLEAAVNGLWDSNVNIGDKVLIVGFGIIGSLLARLLSFIQEVEVEIIDIDLEKIALAEEFGFIAYEPEKLLVNTFDLSFHASASGEGLQSAINAVGFEGKIIDLSWYGVDKVNLHLGGNFHKYRKKIISSQVTKIASVQRSRWSNQRRKELVFKLLRKSEFDQHITHTVHFDDLPQFFTEIENKSTQGLSYLVNY